MSAITVQNAATDDIDAIVASVAGLFQEDSGRHDALTDPAWPAREGAAYYARLAADRTCLLLLARDGEQPIGHLVGRLHGASPLRTEPLADLESMRVAPGHRGSGAGSLLITAFKGWARENGARQASVTAYVANERARRFYARHGFEPMSVTARAIL